MLCFVHLVFLFVTVCIIKVNIAKEESDATSEHFVEKYELGSNDIILTRQQHLQLKLRSAYLTVKKWPAGVVPYTMDSSFKSIRSKVLAVNRSVEEYSKHTCIRLVPRTSETNYIKFINGQGCYSSLGVVGGEQAVSLGPGCDLSKGTPLHEIMHALGFMHEQQRPDRDDYIIIHKENIVWDAQSNFDKVRAKDADLLNITYDLGSVMHYPKWAFAVNNYKVTIETKDKSKQDVIGQRNGFAPCDIAKINVFYGCGDKYKTTC